MWKLIKSLFKRKHVPDINRYNDILEQCERIKKKIVYKVVCPICKEEFDDNVELIQHGMKVHNKTFEEMKQLIELTK